VKPLESQSQRDRNDDHVKLEHYREQNEQTARIVAANPELYPPGSLMATWAEMVLRIGINIRAEVEARAGLAPAGQTERKGAARADPGVRASAAGEGGRRGSGLKQV
jgi:hypothetical protein